MKNIIITLLSIVLLSSCDRKEEVICTGNNQDKCIETFMAANDLKMISGSGDECIFYNIYAYQGNFYFELICCVCDMIPSFVDCEGNLYASLDSEKYKEIKQRGKKQEMILIKK